MVQGPTEVMDLHEHSDELRGAVLETLKEHGIEAHKGQQVMVTDPAAQAAILQTLAQHGVNVDAAGGQGGGLALGALHAGSGAAAAPDPIDQIDRLAKLRDSGVLSDSEFEQEKRKLLGG